MSVRKIEALADAISKLYGGLDDPASEAYKLRNPLLITSFARVGKHKTDEHGRRKFTSFLNGYKAGLFDLEVKISGHSRANVNADSPLYVLLVSYGIKTKLAQDKIVNFLRRALNDQNITINTAINYFLEDNKIEEAEN
jgi:hypothetical protein